MMHVDQKFKKKLINKSVILSEVANIIADYHANSDKPFRCLSSTLTKRLLSKLDDSYDRIKHQVFSYLDGSLKLNATEIEENSRVYIYCLLLPRLRDKYIDLEIPLKIFNETISDLFFRIKEFYNTNQHFSFSDEIFDWLSRIFIFSIFKIGELQFEVIRPHKLEFDKDFQVIDSEFETLHSKRHIINVHIMEASQLTTYEICKSFNCAEIFFKTYFKSIIFNSFYCYSWLLYPNMMELLESDSRIRNFYKFFKILGISSNKIMAFNRLFDKSDLRDISKTELTTRLQVNAFKSPKKLGVGFGVYHLT